MRRRIVGSLVLFLGIILTFAGVTFAADVRVEIVDCGIYKRVLKKTYKDDKAVVGYQSTVKNVTFIKQTTEVPATLGTRFGVHYIVYGKPEGSTIKIKEVIIFPAKGLTNPKTKKTQYRDEEYVTVSVGNKCLCGYGFDEAWEAVPGTWIIQLLYKGKKLAEKTFVVYKR